jgi:DNA-binding NarL/FixJ family response regulator
MMPSIRLLLVTQDQAVEACLLAAIQSDPDLTLTARAASVPAVLTVCAVHSPDVVVLAAPTAPLDVMRAVRRHYPAIKVLVCGPSGAKARDMLCLGAAGYLLCESAYIELVGAVRSVYAGHVALSLRLTRQLLG